MRIFKEVDLNNMVKQIKQKANIDDTKKEHFIIETKYFQLQEQYGFLRRDVDNLQIFIRK